MPTFIQSRIKNIQRSLKVPQTGIFDLVTCKAFEVSQSVNTSAITLTDHLKEIQKFLGFTGKNIDVLYGVSTISRIEMIFDTTVPILPAGTSMVISKNGMDKILGWEVSGKAAYHSKYKSPTWPGGQSGVTIGIGYDLGYYSVKEFSEDFHELPKEDLNKLIPVVGKKGENAKNAISNEVAQVVIPFEIAYKVYCANSVPKYAKMAKKVYADVSNLPPDAQAAILSLVYNRGTDIRGDRRVEMKNLVQLIKDKRLKGIAAEFRKMKRLWPDMAGLRNRREDEAVMIENATWVMDPADYIFA